MKPFFMLDKGMFTPPKKDNSEAEDLLSEDGDGVGSVEDVTNEYQKERQQIEPPDEKADENEGDEEEEEEELDEEEEEEGAERHPDDDAEHKTDDQTPQYDEETQNLVNGKHLNKFYKNLKKINQFNWCFYFYSC